MIFVVSALLLIAGAASAYVATGLARTAERRRGDLECEERLDVLRRQIKRLRGARR